MPHFLPPHLLCLFEPGPPLEYAPPAKPFKKANDYSGIADCLSLFEDPAEAEYNDEPIPNLKELKEAAAKRKKDKHLAKLKEKLEKWNPKDITDRHTTNPFKTLFVARLSYDTTESKLKREMEVYGKVVKVVLVTSPDGKSRGYGFVEFDRERDMKTAYKQAEGMLIDDRRILVDMERGRTIQDWRPRRLGGGLGGTRVGGKKDRVNYTGRSPPRERGEVTERGGYRGSRERGYGDRGHNGGDRGYGNRRYDDRGPPRGPPRGYGGPPPRRPRYGGDRDRPRQDPYDRTSGHRRY